MVPGTVKNLCSGYSFANPNSSDPDPAFQVNLEPDPGFWWSKIEKNKDEQKIIFFWSKIAIYPVPYVFLQPTKDNIQHFQLSTSIKS